MAVETRSVVWVDSVANTSITRINSDGGAASIQSAVLPCINADYLQFWESALLVNSSPSPSFGEYPSVGQKAILLFSTTAPGIMVKLVLVAPSESIFLADKRTIDLSNADISALSIACIGVLCTDAGNTATAVVAGYLL
jgi:hypothetical protein